MSSCRSASSYRQNFRRAPKAAAGKNSLVLLGFLAGRYYSGDFDLYDGIVVLAFIIYPIVLFARHRLNAAISTGLMLTFFVIIAFVPIRNIGQSAIPDFNAVYSITMVLICILSYGRKLVTA